ncbi:hypothetical protein [Streptomyces sp. P17]|uniref:hypothetical protein n=1 Tax=Streptomyces sp. P17 TaxID=3074716 RepID=UPI0028F45E7C|nr:hypothetical protein [Streptomyces sp. P17]MDT9695374.1 hypothetical protein [Streptomyces sp. P17]
MTAAPDPTTNVAVELAQLRGEISTGFEAIKGTLAVLVERTNRTDTDVKQLRSDTEAELKKRDEEIGKLRTELEELKKGRWPLAQIAVLVSVGGLIAAVVALFVT